MLPLRKRAQRSDRALDALLSYLGANGGRLFADDSLFCAFYRLTFLLARERGVNTLECSRASAAWRALLHDRFALLQEWCAFVAGRRSFITEDTWRQVLDFCRFCHSADGGLRGYDPTAAWPVLIDEFVEHIAPARDGDPMVGFLETMADGRGPPPHRSGDEGGCAPAADPTSNKRKAEAAGDGAVSVDDLAVRLASNSLDLKRPRFAGT